jgi:hypothetical protein
LIFVSRISALVALILKIIVNYRLYIPVRTSVSACLLDEMLKVIALFVKPCREALVHRDIQAIRPISDDFQSE